MLFSSPLQCGHKHRGRRASIYAAGVKKTEISLMHSHQQLSCLTITFQVMSKEKICEKQAVNKHFLRDMACG
jgi:hypothetical protein